MKECKICHMSFKDEDIIKYNNICPCCHSLNSFIEDYIIDIKRISEDKDFIDAMIKLHDENIIEYQLKMSQFKIQFEQQKEQKSRPISNTPKCPTCSSTDIKKISGLSKAGSVALWGLLSRKIHKQWHCNSCGSEW